MFGPFRATSALQGGLLWKIPWRISATRKYRHRKRLQRVDRIVSTVSRALERAKLAPTTRLARWRRDMPTEPEMLPRDKYTMFDMKVRGFRKGVHKLPKWTRVSQRLNPPGY